MGTRGYLISMAIPVRYPFSGILRLSKISRAGPRACGLTALISITLSACSINLGSLTPASDESTQTTSSIDTASLSEAIKNNPRDPQGYIKRGCALAQAGKTEDALADFNKAIALASDNADAYYNRGLLYQGQGQQQPAIDDFTTASALMPQQASPLVARAQSYLALDKVAEAAADLDAAVQADPQNAQAWIARGAAYERLGEKTKAAGSYRRAMNLRPKDDAARTGFARVGGKPGQNYETF
jgi:tetratricopeptide (TPR) repeat protein